MKLPEGHVNSRHCTYGDRHSCSDGASVGVRLQGVLSSYTSTRQQHLGRCVQAEELLCLVPLLWEEEPGLRSIRESEGEIETALEYFWNCTLPFLGRDSQAGHIRRRTPYHFSTWLRRLKGVEGNGNKFLPSTADPSSLYCPTFSGALASGTKDKDNASSRWEASPKLCQPKLCVKTASIKQKDGSLS